MRRTWLAVAAATALAAVCGGADDWQTDFDKASEQAKAEGKCLLLDFTGSDWCGWCKKLDAEVFSQPAFKTFAGENLVCVVLDFPRAKPLDDKLKKQNEGLAQKYEVGGYPTVIILNPSGKKIGQTGYQAGGPEKYVENLADIVGKYRKKGLATRASTDGAKPASKLQKLAAATTPAGSPGVAAAEDRAARTWTSRSGTTVEAALVKESGGVATLHRADGTRVQIAVSLLSPADQAYIDGLKTPAQEAPAEK